MKRTYTIAEAAEATGLSRKAIARRVERGSLQSVLRNGQRRIPRSELVRAGLLAAAETDQASKGISGPGTAVEGGAAYPAYPGDSVAATLFQELLNRLERQAGEIAQVRALTVQAESLHLVNELSELRTRLADLERQRAGDTSTHRGVVSPQGVPLREEPATPPRHGAQLWLPGRAEPHRVGYAGAGPRSAADTPPTRPADPHAWAGDFEDELRSPGMASGIRFALEAIFIGAVAIAVGLADVKPLMVAGVMALTWLIVAISEWVVWSQRR